MTLTKQEQWELAQGSWRVQDKVWLFNSYHPAVLFCIEHDLDRDIIERLDNGFFKIDLRHTRGNDEAK